MARNLELQLLLRLNDQMSSGLKSAMKSAQTETKTLENSISGVATATARIKTTPIDRMTSALRTMRSAAGAAHESMLKVAKASASVASGVAAGGYVLSKPVGQTMDYSMRMAHASNTAFNKRDKLGRIAGKAELNSSIVNAVRVGGGTRDSGAETLDSIISSNGMSTRDAMASLPIFMKAATASGSDSTDLSTIGVRAMQTFKIKQKEMSAIMDIANEGGKAGGFELKDMAKWLPQQMAQSTNLGMSGKADFSKLVAWNQAAVITSGTKDEAGTNLRDLLMEINSPHFAKHLESVGVKNSEQYFLKSQENGVNKVDATVALMEQIVSKNKTYQALQAKLKTANKDDKKAILESMEKQVEGTIFGKVFHNQQSLLGLIGIKNNKEVIENSEYQGRAGEGNSIQNDFDVISSEAGYKAQQAVNEKIFATQTAFENLTPLIGWVANGFTAIAQEYPNLTVASVAATTALSALAVAAGAAGLAQMIGGAKGGGVLNFLKGKLPGGFAAGAEVASGGLNAALGMQKAAPKVAPSLLTRLVAMGALPLAEAGFATAGAGVMAAGAAGYGVGTGLNALGGYAAKGTQMEGFATDVIGKMVAQIMASFGSKDAEQALVINLHLDGEQVANVVNKQNARQAKRY